MTSGIAESEPPLVGHKTLWSPGNNYGDGEYPNNGDGDGYAKYTHNGDGVGDGWDHFVLLCVDVNHLRARTINLVARMQPP